MNKTPILAALFALLPAALSCTTRLEIELQGTWRGQWTNGPTAGDLEVTFSGQRSFGDMTLYDVNLVATGPSCPSGEDRGAGDRTAAFRIDDVHFAIEIPGGAPGAGAGAGIFRFDGTLNGGREIDGSYALTSDSCPACACGLGTSGSWRLLR